MRLSPFHRLKSFFLFFQPIANLSLNSFLAAIGTNKVEVYYHDKDISRAISFF